LAQYLSLPKQGFSECNAEKLFFTFVLISFQASASQQFDSDQEEDPEWTQSAASLKVAHSTPEFTRILGSAANALRYFVELLATKDPRVLVTIAFVFVMTRVVDNIYGMPQAKDGENA
jgi:hypothetical protein